MKRESGTLDLRLTLIEVRAKMLPIAIDPALTVYLNEELEEEID